MTNYKVTNCFGVLIYLMMAITGGYAWAQEETPDFDPRPFDPLFLVRNCQGVCTVTPPGSDTRPAPVAEGRAYPYGSTVTTGPKSSLRVLLSSENTAKTLPLSKATIHDTGKASRAINLHSGQLEVGVGEDFSLFKSLEVISDVGIRTRMLAGSLSISCTTTTVSEAWTVTADDARTQTEVMGPNFKASGISGDNQLQVEINKDRLFLKVSSVKGSFTVALVNHDGTYRTIDLKPGYSVKLWRLPIEGGGVAVQALVLNEREALITDAEGETDLANAQMNFVDRR